MNIDTITAALAVLALCGLITQRVVDVCRGAFAWCRSWRAILLALCVGAVLGAPLGAAAAGIIGEGAEVGPWALLGLFAGMAGGGYSAEVVRVAKRRAAAEAPKVDF